MESLTGLHLPPLQTFQLYHFKMAASRVENEVTVKSDFLWRNHPWHLGGNLCSLQMKKKGGGGLESSIKFFWFIIITYIWGAMIKRLSKFLPYIQAKRISNKWCQHVIYWIIHLSTWTGYIIIMGYHYEMPTLCRHAWL